MCTGRTLLKSVHATDCQSDSQTGKCSLKWYFCREVPFVCLGKRCCQVTSKRWKGILAGASDLGGESRERMENIWRRHQEKLLCFALILYNILTPLPFSASSKSALTLFWVEQGKTHNDGMFLIHAWDAYIFHPFNHLFTEQYHQRLLNARNCPICPYESFYIILLKSNMVADQKDTLKLVFLFMKINVSLPWLRLFPPDSKWLERFRKR